MMRTADMTNVVANNVRENIERTTEEVRNAKRGIAAVVKFLFCAENNEKPYGLNLSPAMKARLAL